ncbi:hypothetical protein [Nitrospirillum iridis]|uniref:Uncharacterized protein n=1 Tax=Nitrospirillum iridis TaxID=765888 RepID=A0A7X0B5B5_9PROT|nr:hypothetical protein [Nitrospirillum iridis]MBB6254721.1 hypothetical protein [Nitrospirillum iridis]
MKKGAPPPYEALNAAVFGISTLVLWGFTAIVVVGLSEQWQRHLVGDGVYFCVSPPLIAKFLLLISVMSSLAASVLVAYFLFPFLHGDRLAVLRHRFTIRLLGALLIASALSTFMMGSATCLVDGGFLYRRSFLTPQRKYAVTQITHLTPVCATASGTAYLTLEAVDGETLTLQPQPLSGLPSHPLLKDARLSGLNSVPVDWSRVAPDCPDWALWDYFPTDALTKPVRGLRIPQQTEPSTSLSQ